MDALADYAAAHGLRYREVSLALPKATQLMRHGFMQEVKGMASGDLPGGLENGWLANVNYVYGGRSDLERSPFTLVLAEAEHSNDYAVRVLCHDKGLGKRDRSNPDSDRQVVELDDTAVKLESDAFLDATPSPPTTTRTSSRSGSCSARALIDWLTRRRRPGSASSCRTGR